jgi:hypothetical protein
MSTSAINNLSGAYLEQALAGALQSITRSTAGGNPTSTAGATPSQPDSTQLSPFAQLAGALQQLQQANPGEYQQFTAQVAANLQSEAQTIQAQSPGTATQLTQLAADFNNASQTGQLPNLQDLAEAVGGGSNGGSDGGSGGGGHGGHHHHRYSESTSSNSTSSGAGTILYQTLTNAGLGTPNS